MNLRLAVDGASGAITFILAFSIPASAQTPDLAAHRALVGHARHSRPENGLAGAMGRSSQKPIPGATSSCTRPKARPARRAAARRRRTRTRPGAASWSGSRPTARCTGRWRKTWCPTHTDGADRNDNKYIDNSKTYHQVNKDTSIGVEFAGNYPDVTRGATEAQVAAWRILVKVLRARYGIPLERVYAHNWIDYKDARYCEGCALATLAREWGE